MIGGIVRGRWWRICAAALTVAALGSAPARSEPQDGPCRISGGYASVLHDQPLPDGTFAYRGVIILRTRACGDGPKGVSGTFAPVAGTPASCTPVETPRIDESRCEFEASIGIGQPGTVVVVTATGHTSGALNDHIHDRDTLEGIQKSTVQPGADVKTAQCALMLPEDGFRIACTLF